MVAFSYSSPPDKEIATEGKVVDTPDFIYTVTEDETRQRLDRYLVTKFPEHSRSYLNKLVLSANILVDGQPVKAGHKLRLKEQVSIYLPSPEPTDLVPEPIEFSILFEDEHLLVLSKPPGLVVHPAAGHRSGTLVNGLLYHCRRLPSVDNGLRPGIVHRLDKDTSGIMVVAKTENALRILTGDFQKRNVEKTYLALLLRTPHEYSGRIVAPIGRHPVHRKKMAVRQVHGKYAASSWQVKETFACGWCLVEVDIETGRTHQIRVHMASVGCPVAGDDLYGGKITQGAPVAPTRQMLHASSIRFRHPCTRKNMHYSTTLWQDMEACLSILRKGTT